MKILITTDLFTVPTNGVVTSVKNLWEELKKRGHEVRILTVSENRHSHKDGDVSYIRSMPLAVYPDVRMPLSYRHKLIREMVAWGPDVIHSQCEFFSYQFALRVAAKTGAPIVHTYHTLYEEYVGYVIPLKRLGQWLVRKWTVRRLRRAGTVIVPTRKVENRLLGYGMRKKLCVIPSGICLEQHTRRISGEEIRDKRRCLGIADERLVLLSLGRLGTEKNTEELLVFFASALARRSDMLLLIVGDGPAKAKLERLSVRLGIGEHVVFTGMVPPSEVPLYYRVSDIFVSASQSETQGLTYVEAMANGLPLLCRRDACLQGVLIDGENGYGYAGEQEFVDLLTHIFRSDAWRRAAEQNSQKKAASYGSGHFADAVETVYYEAIQQSREEERTVER